MSQSHCIQKVDINNATLPKRLIAPVVVTPEPGPIAAVAPAVPGSVASPVAAAVAAVVPVAVGDARSVVDEVDVTEVTVVVVTAAVVVVVGRVTGPWSARLLVGVAIGADDERPVVLVVEPIVAAFTPVVSVEGEPARAVLAGVASLTHHRRDTHGEHDQLIHGDDEVCSLTGQMTAAD